MSIKQTTYPLVNVNITLEHHNFQWKNPLFTLFLWPVSSSLCNSHYQRVTHSSTEPSFRRFATAPATTERPRGSKHCPITWQVWPRRMGCVTPVTRKKRAPKTMGTTSTTQENLTNMTDLNLGSKSLGRLWFSNIIERNQHGAQLNIQTSLNKISAWSPWYKGTQSTKSVMPSGDNWYV